MNWQGGAVLGLLFISVVLVQWIKSFPKDLIFTFAALLTPLFGVVSSKELYHASVNQAILTMLGLWIIGKAMEQQGLFHSIVPCFTQFPLKKENRLTRTIFFLQTALAGAFFHHRYFPMPAFVFSIAPIRVKWKAWVALFLFLAAIAATFFTVAIGTAFFVAGLLLLFFHPFSIKKAFREEFPLPLLLAIFSASIFFIAMQNSGLIPFAENKVIFERVKASGLNDRKWVHID